MMLLSARTTQLIAYRCSSGIAGGLKGSSWNANSTSFVISSSSHINRRCLSIRPKPRPKPQQQLDAESFPTLEMHEVTTQTHIRNFATALALMGFCGGVYYYTAFQAGRVLQGDRDVVDELRLEAKEAFLTQRQREQQREQMDNTLQPGYGNPDLEGEEVPIDAVLAAAAPREEALREEEANYELLKKSNQKKK